MLRRDDDGVLRIALDLEVEEKAKTTEDLEEETEKIGLTKEDVLR